jgi:hypothetical protein
MTLRSNGINLYSDATPKAVIFIMTVVKISDMFLLLVHCKLDSLRKATDDLNELQRTLLGVLYH